MKDGVITKSKMVGNLQSAKLLGFFSMTKHEKQSLYDHQPRVQLT